MNTEKRNTIQRKFVMFEYLNIETLSTLESKWHLWKHVHKVNKWQKINIFSIKWKLQKYQIIFQEKPKNIKSFKRVYIVYMHLESGQSWLWLVKCNSILMRYKPKVRWKLFDIKLPAKQEISNLNLASINQKIFLNGIRKYESKIRNVYILFLKDLQVLF